MQKKLLLRSLLLLVAFTLFYCSEEQIAPRDSADADLLTEGSAAAQTAYSPNVFVIEITTVKGHPDDALPVPVELHLAGTGGKIAINWGDGKIEKYTLSSDLLILDHQYGRVKNYNIKIDGEIKKIETFRMTYQHAKINNLYLFGLTGLKHIDFVLNLASPPLINLSLNKKIETLNLVGSTTLQEVIIPTTNNITQIDVGGENQISTQAIDHIIGRVYQSVVANPRDGIFSLPETWYQEESSDNMVGPPSSYSITKLRKLRDTYGWGINPNFDK
jgi:hypothetical protein